MSLHLGAGVLVRIVATLVAVGASLLAVPGPAHAEPFPTPQQDTYRADWVEGLRSEDLAPSRAAICIVDSGIAITPDTPPDDPEGPILLRTSITPDTMPGTPPSGSGDAGLHGTHMAAAAIAPRNEWGTVGLHPLGRVISVRALGDGETEFSADAVRRGISRCRQTQGAYPRLAAVGLSLGRAARPLSAADAADYRDDVFSTRQQGIAITAAAGNDPAGATQFPADSTGVLAVGASGSDGLACDYATVDDRVDLFGPACGVHRTLELTSGRGGISDDGGSSMAAVWGAETIALLCDLAPDLTGTAAEQLLLDSAREVAGRRVVDVEAAARAAGAGEVVDRARARLRPPSSPSAATGGASATGPSSAAAPSAPSLAQPPMRPRLVVNRITARWRAGRLTIVVAGREPGGRVRVAVYDGRRRRAIVRRTGTSARMTLRLPRRPAFVHVQLLPARGSARRRSAVTSARVVTARSPGARRPSGEFQ